MKEAEITAELKRRLKPSRFKHTLGVAETAKKLAEKYGADKEKAYLAGLLHDCAKNIEYDKAMRYCRERGVALKEICFSEPSLVHAPLGAHLAKADFGVDDEEILTAIYYHTTGHENMALLTKILYIADAVEPGRTQAGVENLREMAYTDLNEALIRSVDSTIRHIVNKGALLDCDTVRARNYLLSEKRKNSGSY